MDYSIYAPQPKPKKSRRKWYIRSGIVLLLIILALGFHFWDSSNKGAISPITAKTSKPLTAQTFDGHYVSFVYHGGYAVQSHQMASDSSETATLKDDTSYEKLLTVRVEPSGGDKLSQSDSSFFIRQSHPELYHSQQISVAGGPATEFIKNDGTEISIYIPVGPKYADLAFSISGSNDTSGLPDEVAALLQTFKWK